MIGHTSGGKATEKQAVVFDIQSHKFVNKSHLTGKPFKYLISFHFELFLNSVIAKMTERVTEIEKHIITGVVVSGHADHV